MATIGQLVVNLEARSERLEAELKKARHLLAQTQADMKRLAGSTATIESQVVGGFRRMTTSMSALQVGLQRVSQAFTGLVSVGTAWAALNIGRKALELGDNIADMADQVGISIEALQRLQFTAEQNGASAEVMNRALNMLNNRIGEAAAGSTEAQKAFAALGLRWQELQRAGIERAFLAVADALQQFETQADKTARMGNVLGDRSRALLNVMTLASQGIQDAGKQLDAFGGTLSENVVRRLATANDELAKFQRIVSARVAIVVADLIPVIQHVIDELLRMVTALGSNNEVMSTFTQLGGVVISTLKDIENIAKVVEAAVRGLTNVWANLSTLWGGQAAQKNLSAVNQEILVLQRNLEALGRMQGDDRATQAIVEQTARLQELLAVRNQLTRQEAPARGGGGGGGGRGAAGRATGRSGPPVPITQGAPFEVSDQGKRLAELDKKFAESQRQLAGWATVMQQLGQPIDQTAAKITLLSQTIQERLALNVPVTSKIIQQLTTELGALYQQLAMNEARLEGLAGLTALGDFPDITPILEQLNAQLRAFDASLKVFGPSADEAANRTALFRQSLEQALQAGLLPFDTAMQKLQRRFETAREAEAWIRGIRKGEQATEEAAAATTTALSQMAENLNEEFKKPRQRLREFTEQVQEMQGLLDKGIATKALRAAQIEFARTTILGQGLTVMADGIVNAFDQSFEGIIQGTLSVSEAFKNMARSILLSISRILVQRGIEMALNVGLGALGAGAGAGAGAGVGAGAGAQLALQHGGLIPGSGPPDSRLAWLTPGEFVLRKEAADTIGASALKKLNTLHYQHGGPVPDTGPPAAKRPWLHPGDVVSRTQAATSRGAHILSTLNALRAPDGGPVSSSGPREVVLRKDAADLLGTPAFKKRKALHSQHGGMIPGSGRSDSPLARRSPDEFAGRREVADILGVQALKKLHALRYQHGGMIHGSGPPDSQLAWVSPGEFIVRREAAEIIGAQTLSKLNALGYQGGGSVPPVAAAWNNRAAPGITVNNIVVRSDAEAQAKRQELEMMEGHIVNVINKQILGGDGSLINRSLRMVHSGR